MSIPPRSAGLRRCTCKTTRTRSSARPCTTLALRRRPSTTASGSPVVHVTCGASRLFCVCGGGSSRDHWCQAALHPLLWSPTTAGTSLLSQIAPRTISLPIENMALFFWQDNSAHLPSWGSPLPGAVQGGSKPGLGALVPAQSQTAAGPGWTAVTSARSAPHRRRCLATAAAAVPCEHTALP